MLVLTVQKSATDFKAIKASMVRMEVEITRLRATGPTTPWSTNTIPQPQPYPPPQSPPERQAPIHDSLIKASFSEIDENMLIAIRDLWKKFLEPEEDMDYYTLSQKEPLQPNILTESFPSNFKVPWIELYDEMIDPNDHIKYVFSSNGGTTYNWCPFMSLVPKNAKGCLFLVVLWTTH